MTKMLTRLLACTALGGIALLAAPAAAQTSGAQVVFLPDINTSAAPTQCRSPSVNGSTSAAGISADGSIVAGSAASSFCIVLWRNGVPQLQAGSYPGFPNIGNGFAVNSMSGDGRAVVGYENETNGSLGLTRYWTAATDAQFFPVIETISANTFNARFPTGINSFFGRTTTASEVTRLPFNEGYVNGDGTVYALNSAFTFSGPDTSYRIVPDGRVVRWQLGGGYTELPTFGTNTAMTAAGIDSSGNRIVGTVNFDVPPDQTFFPPDKVSAAFVWDSTTGLTRLPDLASTLSNPTLLVQSGSTGISRDGTTILGYSRAADGIFHPVLWRGGAITDLGFLSGRAPTTTDQFDSNVHTALAASAGGAVVVGIAGDSSSDALASSKAWRWTATTGMQDLNLIASNAGINLAGFNLWVANGVSDNGQFISGNAFNATTNEDRGFVLQIAQITRTQLIVRVTLPGVTLQSIVNQTFNTQVDGTLNGQTVFTRSFADTIDTAQGATALADARAALQVGGALRRITISAPRLLSNTTTVLSNTNSTVNVLTGTSTNTATVNSFGPGTVQTGDRGICATAAANNTNPTGCSLPGITVNVGPGILNSNIYTNTIQSVTPTTTPTVNQLVSARWQVAATAGNQFGTVHALVGPAAFERGDRLSGQLLGVGDSNGTASSGLARAAMPGGDESRLGGGENGLTMFGGYFGSISSIDADASIPVARVKGDSDGFILGLQKALGDSAYIGIAVDHGSSDYTVRDPLYPETLKLKHTQAALFTGWSDGGFSLSGAASFGFGTAGTNILTPTTPARGKRNINSWTLGAQAGYAIPLGKDASLTPHIGIRYTSARLKGFTEVGGPTPLRGLSQNTDRTRFYAGVEAKTGIDLGGLTLTPRVYGRIARDSGDASGTADLVFASAPAGPAMQAFGPGVGKTAAEVGGGLDASVSDTVTIWAGYDGRFRDSAKSHSAKVGLSINW